MRLTEAKNRSKTIYDVSEDSGRSGKIPELHRYRVLPGGGMGMTAGSNVELDVYGYDLATTDRGGR